MSIDDPRQVRFLIEKMEASLPIPVRATPETLKIAETKGERYKPDHQFSIDKIFYTGDEGGIICSLIALQDGKTGKALRIAKQNRPNKGFGK